MGRSVRFHAIPEMAGDDHSVQQLVPPSVLITRTPSIQAEMSQAGSCEMLINNQDSNTNSDEFINVSIGGPASSSGRRCSIDGSASQSLGKFRRSSIENAPFPFSTGRRMSTDTQQQQNLTGRRFSTDRRSSMDRSSVNRRSSIESQGYGNEGHRCIVTGRKMSVMSVPELPGKFTLRSSDTASFSSPEIDSSDNCSIPQLPRGGIQPLAHIPSSPEFSIPEEGSSIPSLPGFGSSIPSLPSLPKANPYHYDSNPLRPIDSDASLQSHVSLSEWEMVGDSLQGLNLKEEDEILPPAMPVNVVPPERPGSNVVWRKPITLTPMRLAPTDGPRCVTGRRLSGGSLSIPPLPYGEFYINNQSSPELTPMAEAGRRSFEIGALLRDQSLPKSVGSCVGRRKSLRRTQTG